MKDGSHPELYDLATDRAETKNLATAHPDVAKRLKRTVTAMAPIPASTSMIRKRILTAVILTAVILFRAVACAQTAASLPAIRQNGAVRQLFVDDKPFIMLSGELHNSTASSLEYMKPVFDRLAALHLNTVIGTVSWELMEPEEGRFDFSLVDAQIDEARRHNLRLVLIWFGTYKTALSSYVPEWVKVNRKRFPPMVLSATPICSLHSSHRPRGWTRGRRRADAVG